MHFAIDHDRNGGTLWHVCFSSLETTQSGSASRGFQPQSSHTGHTEWSMPQIANTAIDSSLPLNPAGLVPDKPPPSGATDLPSHVLPLWAPPGG